MSKIEVQPRLTSQDLAVEKRGKIWMVRLNRPSVANALRKQTLLELIAILDSLEAEPPGRVMIITGEGKSFCAGGDIKEMQAMTERDARGFGRLAQSTVKKMTSLEKPIIAAVNGPALGAGFDLATSCDLVVASENATFGSPTLRLGIITPFGGSRRLPRMIGPTRAKHLIFTAETLDSAMALQLGLVNKVVAPESLIAEAQAMADNLLEKAPIALGFAKRLANLSFGADGVHLDELEVDLYSKCFRTSDQREGMNAFLEKRKAVFAGK